MTLEWKFTATQSNSGTTVHELSPICMKWFQIFAKIEIKVFQNPKYLNKTIVSMLTWFITKNSKCLEQISIHSRLLFQFWYFISLRIVVRLTYSNYVCENWELFKLELYSVITTRFSFIAQQLKNEKMKGCVLFYIDKFRILLYKYDV